MYGIQILVNGTPRNKKGDILFQNIECRNYMIEKFAADKLFVETEDLIILLDGVITNKRDLLNEGKFDNWAEAIASLYCELGNTFFSKLRGSFAGAIYDKSRQKLIVFTDQLGSKFIYYSHIGSQLFVSQMMGGMYDLLKEQNVEYHLDPTAAKVMLTYGFMIEDYTLCKEVKKIEPGCFLTFENEEVTIERYYTLNNTPDGSISEAFAIEEVDRLFRQAVRRNYEKDLEYGYKHVCALSGGLDCRMTTWVAHEIGYTNQLNMTFSQTDYYDQSIPQQITADLKHEWLFKALDNGMWLYDIDEVTRTTGGNVLYYGTAHGNSLLKYIDFKNLGVLHSGQIGDITISSKMNETDFTELYELGYGAYSQRFLKDLNIKPKIKINKELGFYYYRALNGTNNGLQNIYNYTETLSPFMDLDFLEFALKIPVRLRAGHHLYKKWVLQKYPGAAKYIWETTGCKIDAKTIHIGDGEKPIVKIPYLMLCRLRLFKRGTNSKKHMNPVGFYLSNNEELYDYIASYFKYVDQIEDTVIRERIITIIEKGTPMEKIQLVSLLASIKLYYAK